LRVQVRGELAYAEAALAVLGRVDLQGCLIAVAPTVRLARVVSAAAELARALGYAVEAPLKAQGR
jgi:hypothetical protein